MITKEDLLDLLIESSKQFKEIAKKELSGEEFTLWIDKDGTILGYIVLGDYAHHIIELYQKHETEEFHKIFDLIEKLHIDGDAYVKEAATIGILEGIQNIAMSNKVDPEVFVPFLRPQSLKFWRSLNDFWNGKIPYVGYNINNKMIKKISWLIHKYFLRCKRKLIEILRKNHD